MWSADIPADDLPPIVRTVLEHFDGGDWPTARRIWEEAALTNDERGDWFRFFDSQQRAWLKYEDRKYLQEDQLWVEK